ncbi:MAG: hypothetical protein WD119_01065 [Pirellulaceae bacterium]
MTKPKHLHPVAEALAILMRFSLRAFLAAASAVYAVGALSAQAPNDVPPGEAENRRPHSQRATPGQAALTSTILNTPEFGIPFSVDSLGSQPVEVQLYVSRDAGTQWAFSGRQPAHSREFPFQAASDGDYWFATRTIDANGSAHPQGKVVPQLRVTVDTTNPQIEAKADADSDGQIIIQYRITDASPHADGIRVEYMSDAVHQWMPVETASQPRRQNENSLEGRIAWIPQSEWRRVSIRMMVRDQAGNQTVLTRQVERPRVAQQPFQLASKPAYDPNAAARAPFATAPQQSATPQQYMPPQQYANELPPSVANRTIPDLDGGAFGNSNRYAPDRFASNQLRGLDLNGPADATSSPGRSSDETSPPRNFQRQPQAEFERTSPASSKGDPPVGRRTIESATRPLPIEQIPSPTPRPAEAPDVVIGDDATEKADERQSATQPTDEQATTPVYQNASVRLLDQLPQGSLVRRSNTRTFSLDYEIDAVGSQGLDSIELWCTKDGGETWKYWDKDPDEESPFDIITANDGLYGFRMVVVGGNGLTSPRPVSGDNADIYVLVDTVDPEPRITGARYGEGDQTGKLVIDYRCDESNETLASRPIRFAFAEELEGPWTTIATGLANEGQYLWPADPQLPRRIYLRIEVTDKAGNVGVDTLSTPIDVQGLAPRARIRGFQPVTESAARPSGQIR